MNAPYEMAMLLKARENAASYSPLSGVVEQLPDIKIRLSEKIVLSEEDIASVLDLKKQDHNEDYVFIGKSVYLLPMKNTEKSFLVIGVDML